MTCRDITDLCRFAPPEQAMTQAVGPGCLLDIGPADSDAKLMAECSTMLGLRRLVFIRTHPF